MVPFKSLKKLLKVDSVLNLKHEKWFRNLSSAEITVKKQIYKLTATENKRELIYIKGKLEGTKPYVLNKEKEIK